MLPRVFPKSRRRQRRCWKAAFAKSSAAGLVLLASHDLDHEMPAELIFWRGLARRFFQAVCHEGEGAFEKWSSIAPPSEEELSQLVTEAPPMRGLEYLNAKVLAALWTDLRDLVVEQAGKHSGGPAVFLAAINPLWHLLGRVTFHLAENKAAMPNAPSHSWRLIRIACQASPACSICPWPTR